MDVPLGQGRRRRPRRPPCVGRGSLEELKAHLEVGLRLRLLDYREI